MNQRVFVAALAVVGIAALAAAAAWLVDSGEESPEVQDQQSETQSRALGFDPSADPHNMLPDGDRDGLADVLENYVYGSDPAALSSTGNGIPDGWFARFGFDPTTPGNEARPGALPPAARLPDAYGGVWPEEFAWTLADAYAAGRPDSWEEATQGPWDSGIDPRRWADTDDGIPFAWLIHYGLDSRDSQIGEMRIGDDGWTVRQNYEHNTDPRTADTDGDGLTDAQETELHGTDPLRASTSGTGIPDGWLVRFNLDARDPFVGSLDVGNKGLSVLETFEYNLVRFGREATLDGAGLDPRAVSSVGGPVPDGWLIRYGLDALDPSVHRTVIQNASDFPGLRHLDDVPEGATPIPDLVLRVEDAYRYQRPSTWTEADDGPWLGGLDPSRKDQDGDGLPDAVEIRGWYATRAVSAGPGAEPEFYRVTSNSLLADTDQDGLTDAEEHDGRADRDDRSYVWLPSDPRNPDTAFSGLTDAEKILGFDRADTFIQLHTRLPDGSLRPLLEPVLADSDGDYAPDGVEVEYWVDAAASAGLAYTAKFPGSGHGTYDEWVSELDWRDGRAASRAEIVSLLSPKGDMDGDGLPNVVDPDSDGDGLFDGWEMVPATLRFSDFASDFPRSPTDPANPDTDGDGLPDEWEIRHGRFILGQSSAGTGEGGRWDLNPARFSSAGDGQSDGRKNIDRDTFRWFSYERAPDGQLTPVPNDFNFTNAEEFQAGTNPRLADENSDNVSEGWAVFWGRHYPQLVANAEAGIGDAADLVGVRLPVADDIQRLSPMLRNPLLDLGNIPKAGTPSPLPYQRFVEVPDGTVPASVLRSGFEEEFESGWPRSVQILREGFVETRTLGIITGKYQQTLEADYGLGLNPYLFDTDGDGMSDAWETHLGRCPGAAVGGADPAVPDATADPDGDEMPNAAEFSFQTHPCVADTDLGGLKDGTEIDIRNDPTAPNDDATSGDDKDSDSDGVRDDVEVRQGTNPLIPDTDFDGLLDGQAVELFPNSQSGMEAGHPELVARFQSLGIAHVVIDGGNTVRFFGETDFASDPRDPDTSDDSIPDGWLAYYQGQATQPMPHLLPNYSCGRPAWWSDKDLGVWWWGLTHTDPPACGGDRDFDGLLDVGGEDPTPAARRATVMPGPDGLPEALGTTTDAVQLLQVGQTWGDCAGNPQACRLSWKNTGTGPQAPILLQAVTTDLVVGAGGPAELPKSTPFSVQGQVRVDCGGASPCIPGDLGNRVIVARLAGSHGTTNVLGVAFTEADGTFAMSACFCATGSLEVPPGSTALGADHGEVAWSAEVGKIKPGAEAGIILEAYATSPTVPSGHPQSANVRIGSTDYVATGRAQVSVAQAKVVSATTLKISSVDFIPWGPERTLPLDLTLADGGNAPVSGALVQIWIREADSMRLIEGLQRTTDLGGRIDEVIPISDAETATHLRITAEFAPPSGPLFGSSATPQDVSVQQPVELRFGDLPPSVYATQTLSITVEASSRGTGLEGVSVDLTMGPVATNASTGPSGFTVFEVPLLAVPPGGYEVVATAVATDETTASEVRHPIQVLVGSSMSLTANRTASAGDRILVQGVLLAVDGSPISGAPVFLFLDGEPLSETSTNRDGVFEARPQLPATLPAGPHTLLASYGGDDGRIDASSAQWPFESRIPSVLQAEAENAARGGQAFVTGRLADGAGNNLSGRHVEVHFDGVGLGRVLTGPEGEFVAATAVPDDAELGAHSWSVRYRGSASGVFGPTEATASFLIGDATTLHVEPVEVARGPNILGGYLRTDLGEPVRGATIRVSTDLGADPETSTGVDGGFRIDVSVGSQVPAGNHSVHIEWLGDDLHGPANATIAATLVSPSRWSAFVPHEAGRGSTLEIRAALLDDRGVGIPQASFHVKAGEERLEARTADDGTATLEVPIPLDTPLGAFDVTLQYEGSAIYDQSRFNRTVLLKEAVLLEFQNLPSTFQEGSPAIVTVRATDLQGNPVAGQDVSVRPMDSSVAYVGQTDSEGIVRIPITPSTAGPMVLRAYFGGTQLLTAQQTASDPVSVQASHVGAGTQPGWLLAPIALASVMVVWWLKRRNRPARAVRRIFEDAADRIKAGSPWAGIVMLAYRRLSDYVRQYGFEEREGETAREFVSALVKVVAMPPASAVQLINLFEAARYTDRPIRPMDAVTARRILMDAVQVVDDRVAWIARRRKRGQVV